MAADLSSSDAEEIFEQQLGHAVIEVDNFHFFTVSGYKGDPNLDYLQLHASNATLYHSSHLDGEVDHRILQEALSTKPHMRTIYQSESSVLSRSKEASGVGTDGFASLSLAMKTTRSKQRKVYYLVVDLVI